MFQWCLLIRYSDLEAGKDILSHHILNYRTKNFKHFASTSNYNVEKEMATHSSILAYRILWTEKPGRLLSTGSHRVRHDWSDLACVHALEKEIATHSSVLAWRIPETEEPGGLPSMGSHRVGYDWSDLAAAAESIKMVQMNLFTKQKQSHRRREQTYLYQGEGREEGWIGSLGLTCIQCYI